MREYRPTIIDDGSSWLDHFAPILVIFVFLLLPIIWPLSQLWRLFRLMSRGYYVTGEGRDNIQYQELDGWKVRRLTIYVERMVKAPDVVYVPAEAEWEQQPSWAQGRREEIVERVRRYLGNKNYEYVTS